MNNRTILLSVTSATAALGIAAFIAAGAAFASPSTTTSSSSVTAQITSTVIPVGTPVPTAVASVTPTQFISTSRPALAISKYFTVPVTQVLVLRSEGWGYGEIFKLYRLSLVSGKTVTDVKALRDSGLGWGNVAKQLGVHPGNAGFNLGAAMSEREVIAMAAQPAAVIPKRAKTDKTNPAASDSGNPVTNDDKGNSGHGNGNGNGNGHGNGNQDKVKKKDK